MEAQAIGNMLKKDQYTNVNAIDSITVKSETFKQRFLRKMYPVIRKMGRKGKNGTVL